MTDRRPESSTPQTAEGRDRADDRIALTPPEPVPPLSREQAAASLQVDEAAARQIEQAVATFVESLAQLDVHSPDFQRKVDSVTQLGNQEIRRSAEVSNRLLERPAAAMEKGPLGQGSNVSRSLLALRRQIEELDPQRQGLGGGRRLLGILPLGNRMRDYFRRYQSAQGNLDAIIQSLYHGQEELQRDNAAIDQEKVNLWQMKTRLEQYAYMAAKLDEALEQKVQMLQLSDPERARAIQENVLFYVRQKRQDILTQLAVSMQGYLALDLIRKNNLELIKGVDRATTTTISALRTAVIVAQALTNQKLVLDQITALNTTTGNLIESTSQMLRQQTEQVYGQAAAATVDVQKLQAAFNNVYATIDMIDRFKVQALDGMKRTVDVLSTEVEKARAYIDRAQVAEVGQARAASLTGELSLPSPERKG
ncbi:MAG TPA: toxic anion resistance protein [Candidatus Dormibacteraeota bacterium]|nr:toxic anion resistance protein [Candidatus Dormibacteraeota bacterium]